MCGQTTRLSFIKLDKWNVNIHSLSDHYLIIYYFIHILRTCLLSNIFQALSSWKCILNQISSNLFLLRWALTSKAENERLSVGCSAVGITSQTLKCAPCFHYPAYSAVLGTASALSIFVCWVKHRGRWEKQWHYYFVKCVQVLLHECVTYPPAQFPLPT